MLYELLARLTKSPLRRARLRRWGRWLPRVMARALCWLAAFAAYAAHPGLRRHLHTNLRAGVPNQNAWQRIRTAVAYLAHMLLLLYEVMVDVDRLQAGGRANRLPLGWRGGMVAADGLFHLDAALRQGRGAIVYAPHMGNFFYTYWFLCQRYPCMTVGTAGSPELRPLYETFHDELGCPGLDYDATPPRVLVSRLRRHLAENGVVLLLGDFWRPGFPPARFLGQPSRSPQGAATFALDGDVPIVPAYSLRAGGRQRLMLEPPRSLRAEFGAHDRAAATDALNDWMSALIRRHPAQWLYWFNVEERWEPRAAAVGAAAGLG